ncbi:hypothetical protein [Ferruginibacter sp.]|nr:hypothetical protein [Ferruginibacter sp.]
MDIGLPLLGVVVFIAIIAFRKLKTIKQSRPFIFGGVIFISCFLFLFGANEFFRRVLGGFAGSYPFAESWNIAAKEEDVIKAIQELKDKNPNLRPQNDTSFRSSYWFHVDFNYPDTKQIVHTWTRPGTNEFTTDLAFISLSSSDKNGGDKLINKDFWYWSNKQEINKFKTQIIDKLEQIVYSKK